MARRFALRIGIAHDHSKLDSANWAVRIAASQRIRGRLDLDRRSHDSDRHDQGAADPRHTTLEVDSTRSAARAYGLGSAGTVTVTFVVE